MSQILNPAGSYNFGTWLWAIGADISDADYFLMQGISVDVYPDLETIEFAMKKIDFDASIEWSQNNPEN